MPINSFKFAICINNSNCDDLELLKVYPILPDSSAEQDNYIRIIDESGEDYLYPQNYFTLINVSPAEEEQLRLVLSQSRLSENL
ncbi:hypothetical protein PN462_14460 [Spirulina sp. CS-785/01]|uniref:hypothetical protein n=1 Tax=Spirulina sp. CS-785/01 TaxID=3021716 RepID=UPI00232E6715|nr:hypothetical protein [Spirulina sp. CS-785/01]MDB9314313.1 hypothetical protein [Spirulina sp. CS-785/01]